MRTMIARAERISGPALAALGLVNALFAISFVAVLMLAAGSVNARSAETCSGHDILQELKRDAPGRYQAILDEAAAMPNADTRLFRVEKAGAPPSFLFGTMHLTDERVLEMPAKAKAAFDGANTVAIETTEILDPSKAQAALFAKPDLTMFTDGSEISDYLTDSQSKVLKKGLAAHGLQLALVERMKPWLLISMIALPACEKDRQQEGGAVLDVKLAHDAQKTGKKLVGLETIVEQFEAMASLPIQFHIDSLVETIAMEDRLADVTETMIDLYVEGRIGTIWPMLRDVSDEYGSGKDDQAGYADFEEALVNARNRTMFERSRSLIDAGGAFIAVGALHLPGEKGLANLFHDAGYTVTPIREN